MAPNVSAFWLLIKGCTAAIFRHVLWRFPDPADSFPSLLFLHMPIQTTVSQGKETALVPSSAAQSWLSIFCSVSEKNLTFCCFTFSLCTYHLFIGQVDPEWLGFPRESLPPCTLSPFLCWHLHPPPAQAGSLNIPSLCLSQKQALSETILCLIADLGSDGCK